MKIIPKLSSNTLVCSTVLFRIYSLVACWSAGKELLAFPLCCSTLCGPNFLCASPIGVLDSWVTIQLGERGGSVVECRTPEQEVGGSKRTAAVLCPWARHFTPQKHWLLPRKRWLRPDMTEKLLTGRLSLNTNKQTIRLYQFLISTFASAVTTCFPCEMCGGVC